MPDPASGGKTLPTSSASVVSTPGGVGRQPFGGRPRPSVAPVRQGCRGRSPRGDRAASGPSGRQGGLRTPARDPVRGCFPSRIGIPRAFLSPCWIPASTAGFHGIGRGIPARIRSGCAALPPRHGAITACGRAMGERAGPAPPPPGTPTARHPHRPAPPPPGTPTARHPHRPAPPPPGTPTARHSRVPATQRCRHSCGAPALSRPGRRTGPRSTDRRGSRGPGPRCRTGRYPYRGRPVPRDPSRRSDTSRPARRRTPAS